MEILGEDCGSLGLQLGGGAEIMVWWRWICFMDIVSGGVAFLV